MSHIELFESTFTETELKKLKDYLKTTIKSKIDYHVYSDSDVEIVTRCIDALTKLG